MPFVMFDVYTAHAIALNGTDAERLALELELDAVTLASRIRYGLTSNALVAVDHVDRERLADALTTLLERGAHEPEQVEMLLGNVRARIAGADLPPHGG